MIRQLIPTFTKTLLDLWDNLLTVVVANLAWAISFAPAILIWITPLADPIRTLTGIALLILLGGPTSLAMFVFTAEASRQEHLELGEFWRGIRQYYRRGWLLLFLNVAFFFIAFVNVYFYASIVPEPLSLLIQIIWFWLVVVWVLLQIYIWPLAIRVEGKFSLQLLFRNAMVAVLKYLFYSLGVGLVIVLGMIGSYLLVFLPTILLGFATQALLSNNALKAVLAEEGQRDTNRENKN